MKKKLTTKQASVKRYSYFWSWLLPNVATPIALTEATFGIFTGEATQTTQVTFMGIIVFGLVAGIALAKLKQAGKLSTDATVQVATSSVGMPITLWAIYAIFYSLQNQIPNLLTVIGGTAAVQTATLVLLVKHIRYRDMMIDWKKNHVSSDLIEV